METYPVLGTEQAEKVQGWIASGRGVRAWRDQLITMHPASDILTPADNETRPDWRHGAYVDLDPALIRYYRPNRVVRTWSASSTGYRAAYRNLPADETRYAPAGIFYQTYRVEEISLSTPPATDVKMGDYSRPLHIEYRWAIVEYTASVDRPDYYCSECEPRTDGLRCMGPMQPGSGPYCDRCGTPIPSAS